MSKKELSANAMKRRWKTRTISFQTLITVIAIIFVLLAFIPIFLMLFLSLKSPSQFYSTSGPSRIRPSGATTTRRTSSCSRTWSILSSPSRWARC